MELEGQDANPDTGIWFIVPAVRFANKPEYLEPGGAIRPKKYKINVSNFLGHCADE